MSRFGSDAVHVGVGGPESMMVEGRLCRKLGGEELDHISTRTARPDQDGNPVG